jgi:hypothetical protein
MAERPNISVDLIWEIAREYTLLWEEMTQLIALV